MADDLKQLAVELHHFLGYLERARAMQQVWDRWYDEGDRLRDDLPPYANVEPHRTDMLTADLPARSVQDENYRNEPRLRISRITKLHQARDRRAAPVLVTALSDPSCVNVAAAALRDIRTDAAIPALLGAAALAPAGESTFREILATLRTYQVGPQRIREAFDAETSPQGRVSLRRLLLEMPDDGNRPDPESVRDALVFLATDDRDPVTRNAALRELGMTDSEALRAAIPLAAHDLTLRRRLRRMQGQLGSTMIDEAAESLLGGDLPPAELGLLLRLVQRIGIDGARDPMRLVRTLHGLTTHPQVGERARKSLCHGHVVIGQMMQEDDALRLEARSLFRDVATQSDVDRFERELSSARRRRGFRARFDRRYRV